MEMKIYSRAANSPTKTESLKLSLKVERTIKIKYVNAAGACRIYV
jgi:hypothetical protein